MSFAGRRKATYARLAGFPDVRSFSSRSSFNRSRRLSVCGILSLPLKLLLFNCCIITIVQLWNPAYDEPGRLIHSRESSRENGGVPVRETTVQSSDALLNYRCSKPYVLCRKYLDLVFIAQLLIIVLTLKLTKSLISKINLLSVFRPQQYQKKSEVLGARCVYGDFDFHVDHV